MSTAGRYEARSVAGCRCKSAVGPWAMPRLVSYSLAGYEPRRGEHAFQFELSVSSLRASNTRIPVVLFSHGPLAPDIAVLCNRFGVMVAEQGKYRDRLAALSPRGVDAMALYPVLHKNLNFRELAAAGVGQVLCCDLDTIFFTDVEVLFDRMLPLSEGAAIDVGNAGSTHPNGDETPNNDGWAAFSGTSASCPQVAGVCALIKQACPRLTPAEVKDILMRTARDVTVGTSSPLPGATVGTTVPGSPAGPGPDNATGAGMVDAHRAVLLAKLRCSIVGPLVPFTVPLTPRSSHRGHR